jgi:hypothetical protein
MEDSPLSITASITGILTFIAAIFAFMYVRYSTLKNGNTEMLTVLESVTATIEETRAIAQARPVTQPGDDAESSRLEELMSELYSTELAILVQYMKVYGTGLRTMQSNLRPGGSTSTAWDDVVRGASMVTERLQRRRVIDQLQSYAPVIETFSHPRLLGMIWSIMVFMFKFGLTPTMMRWYMVREKVLEKIQQREIIRSRLLFYQISTANS